MKRNRFVDCSVIGAALFAMFFGAGNMLFPPYLGLCAGRAWPKAFLGYYAADVGLAVAAMLALARTGNAEMLFRPLGTRGSKVLMTAVVLCLGPLISIPRTAATTFELSVTPLWDNAPMPFFYAAFFALIYGLSGNKSALVDRVGTLLTPGLFFGLIYVIARGVIAPLGTVPEVPQETSALAEGIAAGYQTMDVLAAVVFGGLILDSVERKGYHKPHVQRYMTMGAGLVAGAGLLVVYLGLTYLGATAGAFGTTQWSRSELLVELVGRLLPGTAGMLLFAGVAALACLTTASALTGASAYYLSEVSQGKLSYRMAVVGICVFSGAVAGFGVERLVVLATPVLQVVYPPVLVLILLSFTGIEDRVWFYRLPALTALVISLWEVLGAFGVDVSFIERLPLAELGFAWLFPAGMAAGLGLLLTSKGTDNYK